MNLWGHSAVIRWWRVVCEGSRVIAWANRPPQTCHILKGAWSLGLIRNWGVLPGVLVMGIGVMAIIGAETAGIVHAPVWGMLGLIACAITAYAHPVSVLALLPFMLLASPHIALWQLGGETVFVRIDHALAAGLAMHMLFQLKRRETPLYAPLLLFLIVACVSSAFGIMRSTASSPGLTAAYLAQLFFLGFIVAAAYTFGADLGPRGVYAMLLPIAACAAYGIMETLFPLEPGEGRAYRTFERLWFQGQANHMAGALVLGVVMGLSIARIPRWRGLGLGTALLCLGALPGTGSREGWVALGAGLIILAILSWPRIFPWLAALVFVIIAGAPWEIFSSAWKPGGSMDARWIHWAGAWDTAWMHPVWGLGIGARHRSYYDNHYLFLFAETGIMGLAAFVWWLLYLGRALFQQSRPASATVTIQQALAAGTLAGLAAMSVQSLAASSFIVTMMAGPLYWTAGFVLSLQNAKSNVDSAMFLDIKLHISRVMKQVR